jgi:hypothetical protein
LRGVPTCWRAGVTVAAEVDAVDSMSARSLRLTAYTTHGPPRERAESRQHPERRPCRRGAERRTSRGAAEARGAGGARTAVAQDEGAHFAAHWFMPTTTRTTP